jgi:hypothetical protein
MNSSPRPVTDGDEMPEVRDRFGLKALQCLVALLLVFLSSRYAHWSVALTALLNLLLTGILFRSVWRLNKEVRYLTRTDKNQRGKNEP